MAAEIDTTEGNAPPAVEAAACALDFPLTGRVPGFLALATVPGALLANPVFFGLAGGLLAVISLLLSPPRHRRLGAFALLAALTAGIAGHFLSR